MVKTLHLLNGDSTAAIFRQSGLEGEILVWREMLCEGPLHQDAGSDAFWKIRYAYFEETLGVKKLEYYDKTISELIKIEDIAAYDEVVLWFEYDLFCQVNLLAACSYLLKNYRKDVRLSLVCTGREKGKEQLHTLTDYPPEAYKTLYEHRVKLSRNDLLFAQKSWEIYVENDRETLIKFNFNQNKKFRYLQAAMNQHLMRFPDTNGLSQIDKKILEFTKKGITDQNELIRELLQWQRTETVYGFGDLQYKNKTEQLKEQGIL